MVVGTDVRDASAGVAQAGSVLVREDVDGLTYWSADLRTPQAVASPAAHLLPNYDEYLIAHKDRHLVISRGSGDGVTRITDPFVHHVVIDGRLAGSWTRTVKAGSVAVECALYGRPNAEAVRALDAAAARLGTFLELPVTSSYRVRRSSATAGRK